MLLNYPLGNPRKHFRAAASDGLNRIGSFRLCRGASHALTVSFCSVHATERESCHDIDWVSPQEVRHRGDEGKIGTVSDFLFDDTTWKVRWIMADTGIWLIGRKLLIHQSAIAQPDHRREELSVRLSRQ